MKNLFEKQLNENNLVTEEALDKIKIKKYKNGDVIKVGDKVLYAFLTDMSEELIKKRTIEHPFGEPMTKDEDPPSIQLELIILNESQFDLYTYDEKLQDRTNECGLPIIRLK